MDWEHHEKHMKDELHINETVDFSKLSDEEKWRIVHKQLHEKHKGHENMHAWMILILITSVLVAQVVLVEWKKRHFRSYQILLLITIVCILRVFSSFSISGERISLLGMWIIPIIVSIHSGWWRFIIIWCIVTILTCIVMSKALQKPISGTTPRLVYKWFYLIYMLSYGLGIIGYVVMMLTLLGVNLIFKSKAQPWFDLGLMSLFYGLYYGVLGRDVAEIITDKMAATIGYYTTTGVPVRQLEPHICAVCGNRILIQDNSEAIMEKTFKLACGHTFHEFCIRGWCIVGKKQTCPYCKEKVDLKRMFCNPWEKPHVFYGSFLDFVRYLVAWQPLIIVCVQFINYTLGLE